LRILVPGENVHVNVPVELGSNKIIDIGLKKLAKYANPNYYAYGTTANVGTGASAVFVQQDLRSSQM